VPALCHAQAPNLKPMAHDVEEAKRLLAEAGWADTDGDGILDRDGEPFRFTLLTNQGNTRRNTVQVMAQAMWREVGIDAQLEEADGAAFYKKLMSREYDAAVAGWEAALFLDPSPMWQSDPPDGTTRYNFPGYANPRVDELIQQGLATTNRDEANAAWHELQTIIYEDQPYTFLWWRDVITLIDDRFHGVEVNTMSSMDHLHRWYLPDAQVAQAP